MLLNSIIDNTLPSNIVVFEETSQSRAVPFLKLLLKSDSARYDSLHFICFLKPPEYYRSLFPLSIKTYTYDGFTDPLCWDSSFKSLQTDPYTTKVNKDTHLEQLLREQAEREKGSSGKVIVVFDDVSFLCRHRSINDICRLITSLTAKTSHVEIGKVVVCLAADLLSDMALNALRYIAIASIRLIPPQSTHKRQLVHGKENAIKYRVDVTLKKKSGKVMREVGLYCFTKDCNLIKLKDISLSNQNEDEPEQNDPAANLPFNLKLTDSEKNARSQVRLPYTLDKEQKAAQLETAGAGKIIYQPDDADDFDEEDPDDDLDI